MSSADWVEFWDTKHSIYVNARHAAAHFRRIATDIRHYARPGAVMLDYGCGEALSAALVAEPLSRLILSDPAPFVRFMLGVRFAANNKIAVRKPEDVAAMPSNSIDVIVMHSVAQYLSPGELGELLALFRRLLRRDGLLVLGDIIPRKVSAFADAYALLRFGVQEGFFTAAVRGLARTYFSEYWKLRKSLGLTRYDEADLLARLRAKGFTAERAASNIGHNAKRMTFLAHAS